METNIYIRVKLEVQSAKPLTQEQIDDVIGDLDYKFEYVDTVNTIAIIGSEVQEIL